MADSARFDVVAFGATGFTGRLVAEYLGARAAQEAFSWAIAGRDAAKLDSLAAALSSGGPQPASLVASIDDRDSLLAMARRARVLLTTVGPFDALGEPVVEAAIAGGADYVDITGEPAFVERIIRRHHEAARAAGVRVVHCCGFDSVPHDLGALLAVEALGTDAPIDLEGFVSARGSVSGGTWQSAVRAMADYRAERRRRRAHRVARGKGAEGHDRPRYGRRRVRFAPEVGAWVAPLPTIDPEVVLRSAAALPDVYGAGFRYGHFLRVGSLLRLGLGATFVGGVFALAQLPPTRALLLAAKKSGDGPSAETRSRSRFQVALIGRAGDRRVRVDVRGGDPGYDETAKMISESALCLAFDRPREGASRPPGGVVTPAVAMGTDLSRRLEAAGIRFDVEAPS